MAAERLKNVLLADKVQHPERIGALLENDFNCLLSNYFELRGGVHVRLIGDEDGLQIIMEATAGRVKPFGSIGE